MADRMTDRHLCHVTGNTRIRLWSALDQKAVLFTSVTNVFTIYKEQRLFPVTSLGLVSPLFFPEKMATFLVITVTFIDFTRVPPLQPVTHLFYMFDLLCPLFFLNSAAKNSFPSGVNSLEGDTRGGPSDATAFPISIFHRTLAPPLYGLRLTPRIGAKPQNDYSWLEDRGRKSTPRKFPSNFSVFPELGLLEYRLNVWQTWTVV